MNLAVQMPSGETITARTEEWLAALIVMLPEDQRRALCERVTKKIVGYSTPGSHILRAEGLDRLIDVK
ncbi:MAG: hypothetical protein M3547_00185 [Acidobacteriota bacterium]|nr:hypothetical protein [Acidobacteriota bacterium]